MPRDAEGRGGGGGEEGEQVVRVSESRRRVSCQEREAAREQRLVTLSEVGGLA